MSSFDIAGYQAPEGMTAADRMLLQSMNAASGAPAPAVRDYRDAAPARATATTTVTVNEGANQTVTYAPVPVQQQRPPSSGGMRKELKSFRRALKMSISDGSIDHKEFLILERQRKDKGVSEKERDDLLKDLGWVGSWCSDAIKQLEKRIVGCCAGGRTPSRTEVTKCEEYRIQTAITEEQLDRILTNKNLLHLRDLFIKPKESEAIQELRDILRVALADGSINQAEMNEINELCQEYGIGRSQQEQLMREYGWKGPPKQRAAPKPAPKCLSGPEDALFVDIRQMFQDPYTNQVTIGHRSITSAPPSPQKQQVIEHTKHISPKPAQPKAVPGYPAQAPHQPKAVPGYPAPEPDWVGFKYDLLDCMSDPEVCCCGLVAPCCLLDQIVSAPPMSYDCGCFWAFVYLGCGLQYVPQCLVSPACILTCVTRNKLRQELRISDTFSANPKSSLGDCLMGMFCGPCSLCQMYRELKYQGLISGGPCSNMCGSGGGGDDSTYTSQQPQAVRMSNLEGQLSNASTTRQIAQSNTSYAPTNNNTPVPTFDNGGGYAPSNRYAATK